MVFDTVTQHHDATETVTRLSVSQHELSITCCISIGRITNRISLITCCRRIGRTYSATALAAATATAAAEAELMQHMMTMMLVAVAMEEMN